MVATVSFAGSIPVQNEAEVAVPDLTKMLPDDVSKAQNLGPAGLQGWMHVDQQWRAPGDMTSTPVTERARQIYITGVDAGSPADGVISVGDVILGIDDNPFGKDPRIALAEAINEAEKKENGGILKLLCWRPDQPDKEGSKTRASGSTTVKELKLKVLGTYSDTAPYTIRLRAPERVPSDQYGYRLNSRLAVLKKYGEAVKPYLPELRDCIKDKAKEGDLIKDIQDSEVSRQLITLEDAKRGSRD